MVIVLILIFSQTFWANVGAGATFEGASGNRFLIYFDVMGVVVVLGLVVYRRG